MNNIDFTTISKTLLLLAGITASVFISSTTAFACGLAYALVIGNIHHTLTAKVSKYMLQVCIVGLGFSININDAMNVGKTGVLLTIVTIVITLGLAIWLGRILSLNKHTSLLIGSGTAICGGSAIAAVSGAINAKPSDTTLALSTVFSLNAIALFLFPTLGRMLGLTDEQFGLWSAIAIHDTSSVVGAAQSFSDTALTIATTTKLQRALWIIPLVLIVAQFNHSNHSKTKKIAIPWFIILFILAFCINTWLPAIHSITDNLAWLAKKGLVVTLFLIGASFQLATLKQVGIKPLILGVTLWFVISIGSLLTILYLI